MSVGDRVKFNPDWMTWPQYKDWLKEDETCVYGANCFICRRKFKLSNMGVSSLDSHAKGTKHKYLMELRNRKSASLTAYFTPNSVNQPSRKPCASSSTSENSDTGRVLDEVTKSEIKWCLISAKLHFSNNTSSEFIKGVKDIFETSCNSQESGLAEAMKLSKDKISYMIKYGLGPYFAQNTIEGIKKSDVYSVSFDEAFNKNIQKTQMDIYGRFWHAGLIRAVTNYLGSAFLTHSTAPDLMREFKIITKDLDRDDMIHIGMDGPNVNSKFVEDFEKDFETPRKSAPRQGDLKKFTGTEVSNEKFCPTRWAENVHAAQKAQAEIDDLQKYVTGVMNSKKNLVRSTLNNENFTIIGRHLRSKLLRPRLAFFETIGCVVEPFLREFQSDAPMMPFLFTGLKSTVDNLMQRIVRPKILARHHDPWKIDLEDKNNLLSAGHINIGHKTRAALMKIKSLEQEEQTAFQNECRLIIKAILKKILEKSPLKYDFVRFASFCDPLVISEREKVSKAHLTRILEIFVDCERLDGLEADRIELGFSNLISEPSSQTKARNFDRSVQRLDDFWHCYQAVHDAGGKPKNLEITNGMIRAARNSSARRGEHLRLQRSERDKEAAREKEKKAVRRKIAELEGEQRRVTIQRQCIQDGTTALRKSLEHASGLDVPLPSTLYRS
ncbi:hypothetical protein QAD02_002454 [Eretmocerus hayati]|uniref:Uncharacterized protein n=1 Tax=Eretmocerus hayati TaxID=131215 RepID=A0ACC2NJ51_9HYME|nr:hypothetical protein QAD02_002454 [Eretmocerus hayati]